LWWDLSIDVGLLKANTSIEFRSSEWIKIALKSL